MPYTREDLLQRFRLPVLDLAEIIVGDISARDACDVRSQIWFTSDSMYGCVVIIGHARNKYVFKYQSCMIMSG